MSNVDQLSTGKGGNAFSGALLIAGTSVGAGMLALPFATGVAGFGPAMLISVLCWLYMLCSGLLFLEVTLWMPDGSNVLSMTRRFLGRIGWVIGGLAFIYLYYCLMVAYTSGGSPLFSQLLSQWTGWEIPDTVGLLLFTLVFGLIIFFGAKVTGRINYILMAGLIISYLALLGLGIDTVDPINLQGGDWPIAFAAVPTVFSAFGYHNVVPSVSTYLKRDAKTIRWALVIGTVLPLIIYALWQWIVIGSLSRDVIEQTLAAGEPIITALADVARNRWFVRVVSYFSLFAIVTSLIGVALSMVDFLGDGTGIPRRGWGRLVLCLAVFLPPFFFAGSFPGLFFAALHYAGGFGEATLNGLLPGLMVWVGRYHYKLQSEVPLLGGRWTLSLVILTALFVIASQIYDLVV